MGPKKSGYVLQDGVKKYLAVNFTLHDKLHTHCKNGHVILLFTNNNESFVKTLKQVNELFCLNTTKHQLYNIIKTSKKLTRNYKRECTSFIEFCNQPFTHHTPSVSMRQAMHIKQRSSLVTVEKSSVLSSHEHISILPSVIREPENSIENDTRMHTSRVQLTPKKAKLITRVDTPTCILQCGWRRLRGREEGALSVASFRP
nr:uncharacterized protein LOC124808247 [Hydra vulgaris]